MSLEQIQYNRRDLEKACQGLSLRLLVAFGSRITASPPPAPESDLDLALLPLHKDGIDIFECCRVMAQVFSGYDVDLAFLHQADPLFRYEIMAKGVCLYGDPDDFFEYRAYAYRDYMDSRDLRILEDRLFHKKMNHIRRRLGKTG